MVAPGATNINRYFWLFGLQTYFTAGVKEVRAWTIHKGDTAPQAAGVIHTNFEKGFIRAQRNPPFEPRIWPISYLCLPDCVCVVVISSLLQHGQQVRLPNN